MRISQQQALDCFASDDLIGIGMEADSIRRNLHPDRIVTYAIDRIFAIGSDTDELLEAVTAAATEGNTTVRFVAPSTSAKGLTILEAALTAVRHHFPAIQIQALSAMEVAAMALHANITEAALLDRLAYEGLTAIEGANTGLSPARWLEVHAAAHRAGLRSRATITFGGAVAVPDFVDHLIAIHHLQQESSGFTAISLHGHLPQGDRAEFEQPTAVEYLRTLAIARMLLDNVPNVESSGVDQGLKVMQMALRFGANDGGAIAGLENSRKDSFTESDLRRVIRDAGFLPVERDTLYQAMFLNN